MSKPKLQVEYSWGPRCWFFDEAMAAHDFNGTEHAIMYVVQRLTYSEPDWNRPGRRKEGARISHAEFRRRTGRSSSAIQKAITNLENANVLIVISRGAGRGNSSEYGINARIDEWKIKRTGVVDEEIYPGKTGSKKLTSNEETYLKKTTFIEVDNGSNNSPQLRYNSSEFEVSLGHERGKFTTSEPLSHKASSDPKEYKEKEKDNIRAVSEHKRVRIMSDLDATPPLITCPDEALNHQDLSAEDAFGHCARHYTQSSGRDLSPMEIESLNTYVGLSPFRGTLLRIWIKSIKPARELWTNEQPRNKQGRVQSPFWTLREMAGDEYAKRKAQKSS